jgi:hypothetical protein
MRNLLAILTVGIVLGLACSVQAAPTHIFSTMNGLQEVPGPGAPDGTGTAALTINPNTLMIDWAITVSNIDLPTTDAHIHAGAPGVAGPVVVDFQNHLTGNNLMDSDLAAILADPGNYYVNVHNSLYSAGAVRGQLCFSTSTCEVPAPPAFILAVFGLAGLRLRPRRST